MGYRKEISGFSRMIAFCVISCCVLFWIVDSAIDSLIFHERTLAAQILSPSSVEIWIRSFVAILLVALGVTIRHFHVKSLRVKELHIREVHHRVKNNLAVVIGLLNLNENDYGDSSIMDVMRIARNRVYSIASLHDDFHEVEDRKNIDFSRYMTNLATKIFHTQKAHGSGIRLTIDIPDISIGVEYALPCGLIANELISNALKHAFKDRTEGEVHVKVLKGNGNEYSLIVKDNGSGIRDRTDIYETSSFGLGIVRDLVAQIGGKMEIISDNGTEFRISFKDKSRENPYSSSCFVTLN